MNQQSTEDSKVMVASILSSMAKGSYDLVTPTSLFPNISTSTSTPFTPNSMIASLGFPDFQQAYLSQPNESARVPVPILTEMSGLHPPVVSSEDLPSHIQDEVAESGDDEYSDPEWRPSHKKQRLSSFNEQSSFTRDSPDLSIDNDPSVQYLMSARGKGPKRHIGPRQSRQEKLSKEEEEKRNVRRERNKLAAAKCRNRVVYQTKELLEETENLENNNAGLMSEIDRLQNQREHLEFLLKVHENSAQCNQKDFEPSHFTEIKKEIVEVSRPCTLPFTASISSSSNILTPSKYLMNTPGLESFSDIHTGLTPMVSFPSTTI